VRFSQDRAHLFQTSGDIIPPLASLLSDTLVDRFQAQSHCHRLPLTHTDKLVLSCFRQATKSGSP